jgi:hypothetical protein
LIFCSFVNLAFSIEILNSFSIAAASGRCRRRRIIRTVAIADGAQRKNGTTQ